MEIIVPVLATCGVLYSIIATDPSYSDKIREEASSRLTVISEIAVEHGNRDDVAKAEVELISHMKKTPALADSLAEYVGPECKSLSGGERK